MKLNLPNQAGLGLGLGLVGVGGWDPGLSRGTPLDLSQPRASEGPSNEEPASDTDQRQQNLASPTAPGDPPLTGVLCPNN